MKRIWKFPLEITDVQEIVMPRGVRPLSAQVQPMSVDGDGGLMLWALVDPQAPPVSRYIHIYGTGNPVPSPSVQQFIDTVQLAGGAMVWHVFITPEVHGL